MFKYLLIILFSMPVENDGEEYQYKPEPPYESLARSIAYCVANSQEKVEYCSFVEINDVSMSNKFTQIIFWERKTRDIEIDNFISKTYYVNHRKTAPLHLFVVKDYRMHNNVIDMKYCYVGEGQYMVYWKEKGDWDCEIKRKVYCGDVIFTETDYDVERLDSEIIRKRSVIDSSLVPYRTRTLLVK